MLHLPHIVNRPLELWSFRLWPLFIVQLWIVILVTGGVLGYRGWFFFISAWLAMVGSVVHVLFPYSVRVRYVALTGNLLAMGARSIDYAFDGRNWRVALAGFSIWITIAAAKVVIFFLSSTLVELKLARV